MTNLNPGFRNAFQREQLGCLQPFNAGNSGAAPVPDCQNGESQVFTLTAAATVGAPLSAAPIGFKLFLEFVQDATAGRAVTWNAIYRNAPAIGGGSATAGQRASTEWRWDGVSWQFVGGSTAFA